MEEEEETLRHWLTWQMDTKRRREERESNFAFVCADADGDHLFWLKINDDTSKSLRFFLLDHFQFILLSLFCWLNVNFLILLSSSDDYLKSERKRDVSSSSKDVHVFKWHDSSGLEYVNREEKREKHQRHYLNLFLLIARRDQRESETYLITKG